MITLANWLAEHDFHHVDGQGWDFLRDVMDEEGFAAACSDADWSLFIGPGFVLENTIQGTRRVLDNQSGYGVRSWPTHCEVRELCSDGISAEMLFDEVADALGDSAAIQLRSDIVALVK